METKRSKNKSTKPEISSVSVRIERSLFDKIILDLGNINSKQLGRKVKIGHYLQLAATLVNDSHFEQLKRRSLTSFDWFEVRFKEFKNNNPSATKDQFLGTLLAQNENQNVARLPQKVLQND